MARSHPPTVLTLVSANLRGEAELQTGAKILVAVSGGLDSMVLLHALARLAPRLKLQLSAHGVDHGLRAAARGELDIAQQFSAKLGVPFGRTRVELSPGGNLQARARDVRYAALRAAARAKGAEFVATAHHAEDRAETVLLRLLRGASPQGLAVLPARSDDLLRPLLRARRADIAAHAARHAVPFSEDPSNADPRFLRSRVRHELLPLLAELSPGIVGHLNALADELRHVPDANSELPGAPSGLGRAQRQGLRRLLAQPSRAGRVRLSGGRELQVDPDSQQVCLAASAVRKE